MIFSQEKKPIAIFSCLNLHKKMLKKQAIKTQTFFFLSNRYPGPCLLGNNPSLGV